MRFPIQSRPILNEKASQFFSALPQVCLQIYMIRRIKPPELLFYRCGECVFLSITAIEVNQERQIRQRVKLNTHSNPWPGMRNFVRHEVCFSQDVHVQILITVIFQRLSYICFGFALIKVVNKASKIVNFLKRNVGPGNKEVFSVYPWSPYLQN